jgi:AbrB family looped-hinge helix DNA binding protein
MGCSGQRAEEVWIMGPPHTEDEGTVVGRAQLRGKSQLTLPAEVRRALHIEEGDEVTFTVQEDGNVALRGMTTIPADQKWFWTEEWQEGEREATRARAAGETTVYESGEAFLARMDELLGPS